MFEEFVYTFKKFKAKIDCYWLGHEYVLLYEDGKSQDGTDNSIEVTCCKHCKKVNLYVYDDDMLEKLNFKSKKEI